MRFGSVTGCCAASNIVNLGMAHGHTRAKNQEEFELRFRNKHFSRLVFAITNYQQDKEREYLTKMGFKAEGDNDLQMHTIRGSALRAYMEKRAVDLAKYEQEKNKNKEEEKKALFARAQQLRPGLFMGQVTEQQVRRLRPARPIGYERMEYQQRIRQDAITARDWSAAIRGHYGVNVRVYSTDYNRPWDVRRRVYDRLYRARRGI